MALANLRVYLDNTAADEEHLDLFREIRVDQAIGMASEAELEMDLILDDQGLWSMIEKEFTQAFRRIRIEVKMGEGEYNALIDGSIVAQRFELGAGPGQSKLTLVVHDDSVLLNQIENVALFEDQSPDQIAETLIADGGLTAEVETVASAGSAYTRYVVQRGSAMQLLRDLARRHGMFAYVKPGELPGQSIGVFARPSMVRGEASELLLVGEDRNIHNFSVQLDALLPMTVRAGDVRLSDSEILSSEATMASLDPLGAQAIHSALSPQAVSLLNGAREEQNDLDAATAAAVDLSGFAYTATTEIDANDYDTVLSPYQVISVAGPGGYLGGDYLISRVQHVINDSGYKQNLTLKRNARSAGSSGGSGLPGGVF
jgi:phage protein D